MTAGGTSRSRPAPESASAAPPSCPGASAPWAASTSRGRCEGSRASGRLTRRDAAAGAARDAAVPPAGRRRLGRRRLGCRPRSRTGPAQSARVQARRCRLGWRGGCRWSIPPRRAGRSQLLEGEHDVVEDQGRDRAAVHGPAAELGLHRLHGVGVADPDGDRDVLGGADEPGVAVVLGGAGLAPLDGGAGRSRWCRSPARPPWPGSTGPWRRPPGR